MQTKIKVVCIVVCAKCVNYRKKQTDYMETFYYCQLDKPAMIRRMISKAKGTTPRIDAVMLKGECRDFDKK